MSETPDHNTIAGNRIDRAISLLAGPTESNRTFFETAVQALAIGLRCKWAVIGELDDTGDDINVLAFWNDNALSEPFSYSLADSPCEVVYQTNRNDFHHFYPDQITERFPKFELLKALGAEGYRGELFFGEDGNPAGHVVALMDEPEVESDGVRALFRLITQRTGAEFKRWKLEAALLRSENRYRKLFELLPDSVIIYRGGKVIYANSSAAKTLGAAKSDDLIGYPAIEVIHPDDRGLVEERIPQVMVDGQVIDSGRQRYRRLDGSFFEGESSIARIDFHDAPAAVVVFRDVTKRILLEEQLLQSQKLDAIGKLTGGVAHDFNNLLAVIQGNMEILVERNSDDRAVKAIFHATERGAELTDRLLTFARRQSLDSKPIHLADLLQELVSLLQRTIGEEIFVETVAAKDCWPVMADAGQLENAILNLALNARDAMPEGGTLRIECSNLSLDASDLAQNPEAVAGEYVLLQVIDTGTGILPDVQMQAFEPFFTTKEVGEGSGLGLSMVHGFVKQSGGHTVIDSQSEHGTTVKLYLPRGFSEPAPERRPLEEEIHKGQGQTILLIEDSPEVRDLTARLLESLGYQVVAVAAAASAREALKNTRRIDLILSDVVLPGGISGPEFADEALASRPDLKIIFMSGYPDKAAQHDGLHAPGSVLLKKPFKKRELATELHNLLK